MKLYLVTRRDLPPGAQLAQTVHAARAFAAEHPALEREWFETSNVVVCLSVANETELAALLNRASIRELATSAFLEEDLDYALTAIALDPAAANLVRHLPLALS